MVEVDPVILIAAGTVVIGIATIIVCMRPSSESKSKIAVAETVATKPKKKSKAKKAGTKKEKSDNSGVETDDASETATAPIPTPAPEPSIAVEPKAVKVPKKAAKKTEPEQTQIEIPAPKHAPAPEPVVIAATPVQAPTPVPSNNLSSDSADDEKKGKKAKETAEQRASRLERQKQAKAKKLEEEEMNKNAALQLAAVDRKLASPLETPSLQVAADGWAVVDKKKLKKKVEPVTAAVAAVSAVAAANPAGTDAAAPDAPTGPVIELIKTTINIEAKKIGIIIGPKGSTLHALQNATGVEISTPKGERDSTAPVAVSLTGSEEGVAKVTRAISDLVTKGYSKLIAGEDFKEGSISVHPMFLPDIIGKGGCNIRAIQDFTGVKLNIPQVARNETEPVKIAIAGPKEKVQQAKDLISELTRVYHTVVTHPNAVHLEMDVPPAMYNYIIGSRGSEIKHIQGNFKVSVHIPSEDTVNKSVVIVGEYAGVQGAQKYIQKIIDQANADREAAAGMNEAWEGETDDVHEDWMDEYTHPSARKTPLESAAAGGGDVSDSVAAVAASAWGAKVLSSAEGW